MFGNNNQQIKRFPKAFQKGTEENNKVSAVMNAAGIAAGIILGAVQLFRGACDADQAIAQWQARPRRK